METYERKHRSKRHKWLTCHCCLLVAVLILVTVTLLLLLVLIVQLHQARFREVQEMNESNFKLVSTFDYEKYFSEHSDPDLVEYVSGGVTTEHTLHDNPAAFVRYKILTHSLVDVTNASDTSTSILGKPVSMPIGTSPTAWQRWAHPQGDNATARAAEKLGTIFILSCFSNLRLEEVAKAAPEVRKWQQIYLFNNRSVVLDFVHRAEATGFEALVVTVDQPVRALRYNRMKGIFSYPEFPYTNFKNQSDSERFTNSWEGLRWLRSQTALPIIIKGLQNPDDVEKVVQTGAQGIIVSNHGGRVLDGMPPTIDVLSEVVTAAGGRLEIYLDSGVRTGMDVFKALALGARMVFVGRPMIWGLSHSGQEGVEKVLHLLNDELINTMGNAGAPGVQHIKPSMVIAPSQRIT